MKFFIAVAMMALAASASAGILPYPGAIAVGAPYPFAPISTTKIGPAAHLIAAPHLAAPWGYAPLGYGPHVIAAHAPAAVAIHAPIAIAPAGASYTAATRGGAHTAPLPGHSDSVTTLNLQPAPGTL